MNKLQQKKLAQVHEALWIKYVSIFIDVFNFFSLIWLSLALCTVLYFSLFVWFSNKCLLQIKDWYVVIHNVGDWFGSWFITL